MQFDRVILSTKINFYPRMKQLESMGVPKKIIIDGFIFQTPGVVDFQEFLKTGNVIAKIDSKDCSGVSYTIYPRIYLNPSFNIYVGIMSYISGALIEGDGVINIGKWSQIAWDERFEMELAVAHRYTNSGHNYHSVTNYNPFSLRWSNPNPPVPPDQVKPCRIMIGNDAWIGRGCRLKSTDPDRPLVIGDGAVIASDSVVVKSVEPYTIVGGNPARFIKYRFDDPKVIEGLQRIRWWDWDIDKIHDNYKYFNDPRAFVERFDL